MAESERREFSKSADFQIPLLLFQTVQRRLISVLSFSLSSSQKIKMVGDALLSDFSVG
jgi:hypothetical protein